MVPWKSGPAVLLSSGSGLLYLSAMEAGPFLTLAEQVLATELAYYQQAGGAPPAEDWAAWKRRIGAPPAPGQPEPSQQWRHELEQRGHSLHHYMTTHLSPAALNYWRAHGSLLFPIS